MNEGDRRYFVLDVSGKYVKDNEYFKRLVMLSKRVGFDQHLLTYFLRTDVHDLDCWHPPITEAKKQMIEEQERFIPYSIPEVPEVVEPAQRSSRLDLKKKW
jgi:hypothetical protein